MNNITLNTLFPNSEEIQNKSNIDINSLFNGLSLNNYEKNNFNSKKLLENINERRKKKLKYMIDCYNKCCKQIINVNNDNEFDTFYSVPEYIPEAIDYNSKDCLDYISKNLNEKFIDTCIINKNTIFITWSNLELKFYNLSTNK